MRRYHEQLSEESCWYLSAEDRFTSLKQSGCDVTQYSTLISEVTRHTATVIDLRENVVKLRLDAAVVEECVALIRNFDELKSRVEKHVSEHEAENSKTFKMLSNIDQVQHQVYERGRALASHQAVSSHLETVRFQSEQLEQFRGSLRSLQGDVEGLLQPGNMMQSHPAEVGIDLTDQEILVPDWLITSHMS